MIYSSAYRGIDRDFDILLVDTEFSRLPCDDESDSEWVCATRVVSVGVVPLDVAASGFYAVRPLTRTLLAACSDFVLAEVIPHMHAHPSVTFRHATQLRCQLAAFLRERSASTSKIPLFAADWMGDIRLLQPVLPAAFQALVLPEINIDAHFGDGMMHRHNAYYDAWAIGRALSARLRAMEETMPR